MKEYHNVLYEVLTIFFTKNIPGYFDLKYVPIEITVVHKHSWYQKLNAPRRKTEVGQKTLYYVGFSLK